MTKLYAFEISNFSSSKVPSVVFLNACSSARQDDVGLSEDANNLASAFISAGIPLFIGPLWRVNDDDAAFLASNFYLNAILGFTIGESLRIARDEVKRRYFR